MVTWRTTHIMHTILPQPVGTVIDPLKCFPPRAHKYTEPPRRKSCNFHIKASVVLADTWVVPKIEHLVTPCNHVWKVQIRQMEWQNHYKRGGVHYFWYKWMILLGLNFSKVTLPLWGHSLLMRPCSPESIYLDFPNCVITYKIIDLFNILLHICMRACLKGSLFSNTSAAVVFCTAHFLLLLTQGSSCTSDRTR